MPIPNGRSRSVCNKPPGTPRSLAHLWRMSFALLVAAASSFIGQAKVIPAPVRIRQTFRGLVVASTAETAAEHA